MSTNIAQDFASSWLQKQLAYEAQHIAKLGKFTEISK